MEAGIKMIVLTGGPCAGKTTVLKALQEEFARKAIFVPEVATILLANGFPVPGKDLPWSEEWQACLQGAILPLQRTIENAYLLMAKSKGVKVVVCDRGMLDGAAYTPGGVEEFCHNNNLIIDDEIARYDVIIHLESLAIVCPEKYGQTNNETRFESLERAQQLERAIKEVWRDHLNQTIIDGKRGIEGKIAQVIGIVKFVLSEKYLSKS
ncbi:MAG: ATP-binding protein [Candidatus Harrisonbacteria bacterium]|nr:ATP-binding protein [Candidatus Harrisonbacteria bacterium]